MLSWTSLLPFSLPSISLPTLSVPVNIQRRFISFILKRALGHLVKPGQLDSHQIDAQIGNGRIEINDIELADQAINELIADLPVRLRGGSIGKISVHVPWTNILTAPLSLSINSLDVTFVITPLPPKASTNIPQIHVNLADSVTNVAESFIHEELEPRENQELKESILMADLNQDDPTNRIPGALDPFEHDVENSGDDELDVEGVSVLASLTERILSRFSFDASNITIRLVHENNAELLVSVPSIVYATNDPIVNTEASEKIETRSITIAGLVVSMKDLSPPTPPRTAFPRSPSSSSSDGDYDDDTDDDEAHAAQMMMSQSIVSLPQATSMYHSAMSFASARTSPESPTHIMLTKEDVTLFSSLMDPIMLSLSTTRPLPTSSVAPGGTLPPPRVKSSPKITASARIGVLGISFRAWNVGAMLNIVEYILPPQPSSSTTSADRPPTPPQTTSPFSSPFKESFEAQLNLRSIIIMVLQPMDSPSKASIDSFHARPLSPPLRLRHIRLQVDHIEASFADSLRASVSDVHAFTVYPSSTVAKSGSEIWHIVPIFLFDAALAAQYQRNEPKNTPGETSPTFPSMEVTDWRKSEGAPLKPSLWKSRISKRASIGPSFTGAQPKAISARTNSGPFDLEVDVLPVHVFVDLDVVAGFLPFLDELAEYSSRDVVEEAMYISIVHTEVDETPPVTPRAGNVPLQPDTPSYSSPSSRQPTDRPFLNRAPSYAINISSSLIRLEIRAPPSVSQGKPIASRSGSIIVDIHEVQLFGAPRQTPASRTAQAPTQPIGEVGWEEVLIFFAAVGETTAASWLSIGPLAQVAASSDMAFSPIPEAPEEIPLRPSLTIRKDTSSSSTRTSHASTTLDCSLPNLQVSLNKPCLDGLQLWADDLSQWAERTFGDPGTGTEDGTDDDPSLIGSRFFMKRSKSLNSTAPSEDSRASPRGASPETTSGIVVSLVLTEACIRLWVPRSSDITPTVTRPFEVVASDVHVIAQTKPEGKNETAVQLSVMDLKIADTSDKDLRVPILGFTAPRSINSVPKPLLDLCFVSAIVSDTAAKESRVKLGLHNFTLTIPPQFAWVDDLGKFAKAPPGAFESVVPSERTVLSINITDGSVQALAPKYPGSVVLAMNDVQLSTDLVGNSPETALLVKMHSFWIFCIDDNATAAPFRPSSNKVRITTASNFWKRIGYAPLTELRDVDLSFKQSSIPQAIKTKVDVNKATIIIRVCADSLTAVGGFGADFATLFKSPDAPAPTTHPESQRAQRRQNASNVLASLDEHAFRGAPELGTTPDMINDDLPTNLDYLDASFGTAAGFRDFTEEDLEDFDETDEPLGGRSTPTPDSPQSGLISKIGGETIRILDPRGIHPIENYFNTLVPEEDLAIPITTRVRIHQCNVTMALHSGYDWVHTRKAIEEEVKDMRRKLARIRQLLASGQIPDDSVEDTYTVLFNSVYIGLPPDVDELESTALIAAIDEQLNDDPDDTASQSSWQSLNRPSAQSNDSSSRQYKDRLARSKHPSLEFCLSGIEAEYDIHPVDADLASRLLICVKELEVLDHIKTSTWKKFLTQMREDSKGNIRETGSNMVRIELLSVRPVPGDPSEEARLRAKLLPLRLHVDQDALDFIKKFFAFSDPTPPKQSDPPPPDAEGSSSNDIFFQHVDVFPVEIKLDYKPKRVDYRALRNGQTIELMNFFHFDGSEMTLRHIEMFGVTGWPRMLDMLNDLWTPDVKANQLADVISGIEPIRSIVNVGSGVADLVLLPIAQYRKDGRVIRGMQKGTTSFVKSTAMEAVRLGARLATGTQIILEQAEHVLGGNPEGSSFGGGRSYSSSDWGETFGVVTGDGSDDELSESDSVDDLISRNAHQPSDVKEGIQSAYKSLGKNFNSAAQTILAVPMEVYERSGTEGPVRAVVRAVPIAVLKPMIGASEAVSKTLLGLRNTMDPNIRRDNDEKYKGR